MKQYNYNKEVENLLTLFIGALNNVVVKRYDNQGNPLDNINVRFIYSPKSRTISDIVNKTGSIQIPAVAFWMVGINRDSSRVFNNVEGSYYPDVSGYNHILQPLPIDISISISIFAFFQADIDQIIDNIAVWFDPYIVISHMLPNTDKEVRTIVQWNEQINFEYPTDISQQNAYRLIANTGFTIKGWMYKPYHDPVGKIYKIDTTFSALSSVFGSFYGLSSQQNAYNTDAFTISARPFIRKVTPYLIPSNTNDINISIMGNMFQFVSSLYISANNNMFGELSNIDLYSSNNKLSAIYPPFSGILINNWNIEGNNVINFTLPSASTNGKFDIIVASEPGYGSLINDSRSISPSSIYRFPWEQGVDVFK